jgi:hypothetical protein
MALKTQTDTRKDDGSITIQCWAENDQRTDIFPVDVFYGETVLPMIGRLL